MEDQMMEAQDVVVGADTLTPMPIWDKGIEQQQQHADPAATDPRTVEAVETAERIATGTRWATGLDWPMQVPVWIMLGVTPALAAKAGWGRLLVKRRQVRSTDYVTFVEPTNEAAEEEIIQWEQNLRAKGHRADQYISVKCAECRSTVRFVSKRRTALCRNCGARLALRRI